MKYQNRGKIYLTLGLVSLFIAFWYDNISAGFASGVLISWSYWYWWREWLLKLWNKK